MVACKQCLAEVPQFAGKRQKDFCNNTCRSNYWYGKNKKGRSRRVKKEKPIPKKKEVAPKPVPKQPEVPKIGLSDEERQSIQARIEVVKNELKNPPRLAPSIGWNAWTKVRQNEIKELENKLK